jgi:hypothetical protein
MDRKMTNHDDRFDRLDAAIERSSQRTNELFDSLTQYVLNLREETRTRLEAIEGRLGVISSTMTCISLRIPALTRA